MQGKLQSTDKTSVTFDFDSIIPKDHILKKIDKIIDFNLIRKITEPCYCSNNGRPSIDPELFFRMGYFQIDNYVKKSILILHTVGFAN